MKLKNYFEKYDLVNKTEVEKVAFIAYFYLILEGKQEFNKNDVITWFEILDLPKPNTSRLIANIKKAKYFVKGKQNGFFSLHPKKREEFNLLVTDIDNITEEIDSHNEILPDSIFINTRGYIEKIAKQINSSYANCIYDGCAVLMRRLIEILLILVYQKIGEESKIKNASGDYKELSSIIGDAIINRRINLSKGTKDCIDGFRKLGNFSAHKIEYNCRKADIDKISMSYRATFEELLYKSGINK